MFTSMGPSSEATATAAGRSRIARSPCGGTPADRSKPTPASRWCGSSRGARPCTDVGLNSSAAPRIPLGVDRQIDRREQRPIEITQLGGPQARDELVGLFFD